MNRLLDSIRTWARMVKFSHSIFALPFALSGATLAALDYGITWTRVVWIVVAMVAARNAAMSFNRLADQRYDAANPRTAARELPSGKLSRTAVWIMTILLGALFILASVQLGPLCGLLSPFALVIVLGYSYTKRFSWASHLVLGLSLAMAPVGGWLAVSGRFSLVPFMLGAAVLLWVTGFDVVYACQDAEFDRRAGLFSIPARFGVPRALSHARTLHAMALMALAGAGWFADLHPVYWVGWVVIGGILVWEHSLVRADDLSKLGVAFFNMNGLISVIYLATILVAAWMPS